MRYTISEYAALNKVTYRTVWNWVKSGRLTTIKTPTGGIIILIEKE